MSQFPEFYRRHLPHWQPAGATFFVTFRLKGSLSSEIIKALQLEREQERLALQKLPPSEHAKQSDLAERRSFDRWDSLLGKAEFGPSWLAEPQIATLVSDSLHYRDGQVLDLYAYCIMSNHVHVVFEPISGKSDCQSDLPLCRIMQSLKRHTARQANLILGKEGAFWQDESYDHVIRDNDEFLRIIHYVLQSPVMAGLVSRWDDWPRTYCKAGLL